MELDENNVVDKGRIIFKHKNIKNFKKEFLKIFINIGISIFFGFIGSLIFVSMYSNCIFYKSDSQKFNTKYDEDVTNVINKLRESIVGVNAYVKNIDKNGKVNITQNNMTGVLYSEDGYIVTNLYGLINADKIYVKIPTTFDLVREAKIINYNEKYDLCLLKIDGNTYVKGKFKDNISDVTHGLKLISIENHIGDSNSYSVYSGMVSGFDVFNDKTKIIKSDISINFSNTGGPICDVNGEILGLNSVKFNEDYNLYKETSILISSYDIIKLIKEMIEGATT